MVTVGLEALPENPAAPDAPAEAALVELLGE